MKGRKVKEVRCDECKGAGSLKQLIYLWYISAFYIPLDITPGAKPPLQDDPADTRKKIWVYGTPEQYSRGMIWQVIHAHAPMTPGGLRRYWASKPQIA